MPRRATFDDESLECQRVTFEDPDEKPVYVYAFRKSRTRLDDATIEYICERLFKGSSLSSIADTLCINSGTLHTWKQFGERFNEDPSEVRNPGHEIYGRFVLGIGAALGDNRQGLTGQAHKLGNKNWFQAFRLLERLDPYTYGLNPRGGLDEDYEADEQFL